MGEQTNEIDRNQSLVDKLKARISLFKELISNFRCKPHEKITDQLTQIDSALSDIYSLLTNEPVNHYGLDLVSLLTLAESQIATAKDNTILRKDNEILREYIVGLDERLKTAMTATDNFLKKKGL